jgi:hypothetical protein
MIEKVPGERPRVLVACKGCTISKRKSSHRHTFELSTWPMRKGVLVLKCMPNNRVEPRESRAESA